MKRLLLIFAFTTLPTILFAQSSYLNILALIRGDSLGAQFGKKIVPAGDVNTDGLPDYLVGAFNSYVPYCCPSLGAQTVSLFYGKYGGVDTVPDLIFEHKAQLELFGDLNGDGNIDYTMRETNQRYRMSIYFGGNLLDTLPDGIIKGESLYSFVDCYGCQVSAGKWADSIDRQIVVGYTEPRYDTIRFHFYNVHQNSIDSTEFLRWDVPLKGGYGFQRIQFLGDINGDGYDDLALGRPGAKSDVSIYFGGPTLDTVPDVVLHPPPYVGGVEAENFGVLIAPLGDLNGDGIQDFSAGTTVKPLIYFGGTSLDTLPKFRLPLNGEILANGGDINHDSFNDLVVGWPLPPLTGYVYIYYGGDPMDSIMDLWIDEHDLPYLAAGFGQTISGLGDIDGDGRNDFAIGSTSDFEPDQGYLWLFRGMLPSTDVNDDKLNFPSHFALGPNYPNPFNSSTVIQYSLSKRAQISLEILNITGQRVRVLEEREQAAGTHKVNWDGKDFLGKPVSSGVYLYRLKVGEEVITRKMMLVR